MRELLERYERRVVQMEQMLQVPSNSKETTERLKIKLGVYRNTAQEIKQELELHLVSNTLIIDNGSFDYNGTNDIVIDVKAIEDVVEVKQSGEGKVTLILPSYC